MPTTKTVQFEATPEFHRQLVSEAKRLNLSLSAYIQYLHARLSPEHSPEEKKFEDALAEVNKRFGNAMKKLAK